MKHHALFSSKGKSKKNTVSSAAILLGTLRVNVITEQHLTHRYRINSYYHSAKHEAFYQCNIRHSRT